MSDDIMREIVRDLVTTIRELERTPSATHQHVLTENHDREVRILNATIQDREGMIAERDRQIIMLRADLLAVNRTVQELGKELIPKKKARGRRR